MKAIIIACIFFSFCFGFFLCALFASGKIMELERRVREMRELLNK